MKVAINPKRDDYGFLGEKKLDKIECVWNECCLKYLDFPLTLTVYNGPVVRIFIKGIVIWIF